MGWLSTFGALLVGGPLLAQAQLQKDAQKDQAKALQSMQDEAARKAAEAETNAAVAANTQIAETKRRRRSSALGMGDSSTLGGAAAPLSQAGMTPQARLSYYGGSNFAGTALGAGAPAAAAASRPVGGGGSGGLARAARV